MRTILTLLIAVGLNLIGFAGASASDKTQIGVQPSASSFENGERVRGALARLTLYPSEAEKNATWVRDHCASDTNHKTRCAFYVLVHNRARQAFDQMVRATAVRLESGRDHNSTGFSKYLIGEAAVRYSLLKQAFAKFQASSFDATSSTPALGPLIDRTERTMAAALEMFATEYQGSDEQRRKHVITDLKGLTWRRLDEIKQPRASVAVSQQ